jgi:C1A family cysteine protease
MEYQFYQGGVFDCTDCFDKLNHAVAVVGYQKLNGQGYFILKNTRGLDWGEDGFMKIKDVGDGIGVIGI